MVRADRRSGRCAGRRQGQKKSAVPVLDLFGQAVGIIGMSHEDFCRCDPDELDAVFRAYRESREEQQREEWERMRIAAAIGIQPHVRRKITPQALLPLPWDNKKAAGKESAANIMSPEERRLRFEKLINNN